MTRKCVLCKETNYKNTYSFFSAPKDPEIRKKWQEAIAIENYAVSDDTYVCSKHFHKNDIITHWVSGIPPHVITIKYKKCRLRPGAVPGRHYHLEIDTQLSEIENADMYEVNTSILKNRREEGQLMEEKESFLIPREEDALERINNDTDILNYRSIPKGKIYENIAQDNNQVAIKQVTKNILSDSSLSASNSRTKLSFSNEDYKQEGQTIYANDNDQTDVFLLKTANTDNGENKKRVSEKMSYTKNTSKSIDYFSHTSDLSDEDDTSSELWKCNSNTSDDLRKEKYVDNALKAIGDFYIKSEVPNTLEHLDIHDYPMYQINDNEMLFEDFLEICTEVVLPRGWACMVTSKGHSTTVVYLYMGIARTGMPFVKKQVFLRSDMILRCAATNREIDPLIHNLVREGKHLKVQTVLDIEELIDEFDQRTVCEGVYNNTIHEINTRKIAYKDGIKWRHISCPLIINNDSSRCSRCIALSYVISRKSKKLISVPYTSIIFPKEFKKLHTMQEEKRVKEHNQRCEFVKLCKKQI